MSLSSLQEIERKFLVQSSAYKAKAHKTYRIAQGYLNTNPNRNVRVRIMGSQGFITIKGASSQKGTTRFEWEKEILVSEAEALLALCEQPLIEKIRHLVHYKNHLFEVDEFLGDNQGLVVAEIELTAAEEFFEKPTWLGKEVTGDSNYYNAQLSKHPFKNWP